MQNKKLVTGLIIVILVVVAGAIVYFVFPEFGSKLSKVVDIDLGRPQVVEEELVIPDTKQINAVEGHFVNQGPVEVALIPKKESEKVIVSKAVLTVKGSYELAKGEAEKWSSDAGLVFVKSLGAITLEGKSSQWQLVFSSTSKKGKGYEVIVQGDQVVSKKEIDSTAVGAEVPKNFDVRDAQWAIEQLAVTPQFQSSSISSINFVYNSDAKAWDYVIANSFGNSAIRVR